MSNRHDLRGTFVPVRMMDMLTVCYNDTSPSVMHNQTCGDLEGAHGGAQNAGFGLYP